MTKLVRVIGSCFGPGAGAGARLFALNLRGKIAGVEADIGLIFVGSFLRAGVVKPPWELIPEEGLAFLVVPPRPFVGLLLFDGEPLFN